MSCSLKSTEHIYLQIIVIPLIFSKNALLIYFNEKLIVNLVLLWCSLLIPLNMEINEIVELWTVSSSPCSYPCGRGKGCLLLLFKVYKSYSYYSTYLTSHYLLEIILTLSKYTQNQKNSAYLCECGLWEVSGSSTALILNWLFPFLSYASFSNFPCSLTHTYISIVCC